MVRGKKKAPPTDAASAVEAADFFSAKLHDEGGGLVRGRVPAKLLKMMGAKDGDEIQFKRQGSQWLLGIKSHHAGRRPRSAARA